ncbi:MAG: CaiB/BaiF CoA-transferase family protein, partial [Pseudomonadota bacterium]
GRSLWWSVHGRNKRSITANLKSDAGRKMVLDVARQCDVVVENFKPGQLERLGLGPDVLAGARAGLVIVRISGYGQTGPDAKRAGFGVIGEAKGGLRHLTANPMDAEHPPVRVGVSIGDSLSGLYGALGALAAVIDQRASGRTEPRIIDVALGESVLSMLEGCLPEYGHLGRVRQPEGSTISTASPSNAYRSVDGAWVLIAANSNPLFAKLTTVMGQPDLKDDPRFIDNPSRVRNRDALDALINGWASAQTADAILQALDEVNVPVSKVYTIEDIAADEQYRARDMVVEIADPLLGPTLHPGVVPVVEGLERTAQIRWTGPQVGAHTDEVLRDLLGYEDDQIERLREEGAL